MKTFLQWLAENKEDILDSLGYKANVNERGVRTANNGYDNYPDAYAAKKGYPDAARQVQTMGTLELDNEKKPKKSKK